MKPYKKSYLYLWLLLAVALIIVIALSFVEEVKIGSLSLQKAPFKEVIMGEQVPGASGAPGAVAMQPMDTSFMAPPENRTDTTVKSILIFGDSMTILVANRMAAYGKQNGYEVTSVTWDSSTSVGWSSCDTLENFIARAKPDFIMVTLGSNELFLQNFDARRPSIEKLVKKIGKIPFVWIGPPNWQEDKGFNDMMEATLPAGTYFRTEGMELPRGKDHIHPTPQGGVMWTDSIMRWMPSSRHPILNEVPDESIGTPAHKNTYFRAK